MGLIIYISFKDCFHVLILPDIVSCPALTVTYLQVQCAHCLAQIVWTSARPRILGGPCLSLMYVSPPCRLKKIGPPPQTDTCHQLINDSSLSWPSSLCQISQTARSGHFDLCTNKMHNVSLTNPNTHTDTQTNGRYQTHYLPALWSLKRQLKNI